MSKRFIAFVLAGALTITSISAQPVRANTTDAERFVIGVGALLLLGAAINQAQKDRERAEKKKREKEKKRKAARHKPKVIHHAKPRHHHSRALPGYCLRNVRSYDGDRRIMGARCLQNNYRHAHRLPNRCKTYVEGPRGTRVGYRPRCLRKAGYSIRR